MSDPMPEKSCVLCLRAYPDHLYPRDRSQAGGLDSRCKLCSGLLGALKNRARQRGHPASLGYAQARNAIVGWRTGGYEGPHPFHEAVSPRRRRPLDPYLAQPEPAPRAPAKPARDRAGSRGRPRASSAQPKPAPRKSREGSRAPASAREAGRP